MLRILDLVLAGLALVLIAPIFFLALSVGFFWKSSSPIFSQRRVGLNGQTFTIYKFRTMRLGTEEVATHLVDRARISTIGRILRASKLDELPQIWNVICGDMSLVGPRPCLPSQRELIREREAFGVFNVRPGITGYAQLHGVDMSSPKKLAEIDAEMIRDLNLPLYFKLILATVLGGKSFIRLKN